MNYPSDIVFKHPSFKVRLGSWVYTRNTRELVALVVGRRRADIPTKGGKIREVGILIPVYRHPQPKPEPKPEFGIYLNTFVDFFALDKLVQSSVCWHFNCLSMDRLSVIDYQNKELSDLICRKFQANQQPYSFIEITELEALGLQLQRSTLQREVRSEK